MPKEDGSTLVGWVAVGIFGALLIVEVCLISLGAAKFKPPQAQSISLPLEVQLLPWHLAQ